MSMNTTPIVAGVFQQESDARRALQALRQAGFRVDQIGYASPAQRQGVNLLDNLRNLGVDQQPAGYYDQEFRAGRPVVSVRPDGREQEAHDILHSYGAYDYEHRTGMAQQSTAAQDTTVDRTAATRRTDIDRNAAVQGANIDQAAIDERDEFYHPRILRLREEQLNVDKERVQSGEVGLRKEVVAEQKNIDVPVTHEEVYIQRRPVEGGRVDDTPIGEDETIRIPVSEEQVNVEKRTVTTGEVVLGKRTVEETQQVRDTVRREEVRLDRQGNPRVLDNQDIRDREIRERDEENRLR